MEAGQSDNSALCPVRARSAAYDGGKLERQKLFKGFFRERISGQQTHLGRSFLFETAAFI
jgi:hypothetical protein